MGIYAEYYRQQIESNYNYRLRPFDIDTRKALRNSNQQVITSNESDEKIKEKAQQANQQIAAIEVQLKKDAKEIEKVKAIKLSSPLTKKNIEDVAKILDPLLWRVASDLESLYPQPLTDTQKKDIHVAAVNYVFTSMRDFGFNEQQKQVINHAIPTIYNRLNKVAALEEYVEQKLFEKGVRFGKGEFALDAKVVEPYIKMLGPQKIKAILKNGLADAIESYNAKNPDNQVTYKPKEQNKVIDAYFKKRSFDLVSLKDKWQRFKDSFNKTTALPVTKHDKALAREDDVSKAKVAHSAMDVGGFSALNNLFKPPQIEPPRSTQTEQKTTPESSRKP